MFWGLIMEPERRYTQKVKKSFHISMASLDIDSSAEEPTQVMVGYEGRNYLLCTLKKPDIIQCPLDLEFAAGSEISLASNGKAHVHLTGYLTDWEDDLALADLEEQEEEEVEEVEEKKKKRKKEKKESESPAKKAKLMNGTIEIVEDEESDDPDFEEEIEGEEGDELSEDDLEEVEEEEEEEDDEDDAEEEEEEEPEETPPKLSKKEKKQLKNKQQQEKQQNGDQQKKNNEKRPQKQTLAKGVIVEDLVVGNGPLAKAGKFINVYYEGRLQQNNKMFDSATKGPGFKFRLGAGEVIKGWDIGLAGMKVGGKRKITCPPHAAYGPKGSPPVIPPNSTLVFTVELKKIN